MGDDLGPAIVSVVGALTSVATLGFTVWKGSAELRAWRTQRAATKRAEVAGEAAVAVVRFAGGLRQMTSAGYFTEEGGRPADASAPISESESNAREVSNELTARWRAFDPISQSFVDAWQLAKVYLPTEAVDLMDQLWDARHHIEASQDMYVRMMRRDQYSEEIDYDAFGSRPATKVDALRDQALALLRPLAQLDDLQH